jgi:hypothetical protein
MKRARALELGIWSFPGAWSLEFGASFAILLEFFALWTKRVGLFENDGRESVVSSYFESIYIAVKRQGTP